MKIKKSIKILFIIAAWFAVGSGLLTLLIAANQKPQDHTCKKLVVTINSSGEKYSIDKSDIIKLLQTATNGKLLNQPISDFNVSRLEDILKTDAWISDADIYFDSQDVMHVLVTEKEPVARVFTTSGRTFYIDSAAKAMPLLQKVSMRLPVFTNYPDRINANTKDSAFLNDVRHLAVFINKDPFWNAQIAQIDVAANRTFEAVPTVGNHIIKIGKGDHIEAKFKRLFLFYQKVLSKTGFDKYGTLDIEFDNQIVATHKGAISVVDSIQLQHNIQELLERSQQQLEAAEQQAQADSISNINNSTVATDSVLVKNNIPTETSVVKTNTVAAKPKVINHPTPKNNNKPKSIPVKTKKEKQKIILKKVPKAVMKRSTLP